MQHWTDEDRAIESQRRARHAAMEKRRGSLHKPLIISRAHDWRVSGDTMVCMTCGDVRPAMEWDRWPQCIPKWESPHSGFFDERLEDTA